jgi:hypothetical protein
MSALENPFAREQNVGFRQLSPDQEAWKGRAAAHGAAYPSVGFQAQNSKQRYHVSGKNNDYVAVTTSDPSRTCIDIDVEIEVHALAGWGDNSAKFGCHCDIQLSAEVTLQIVQTFNSDPSNRDEGHAWMMASELQTECTAKTTIE